MPPRTKANTINEPIPVRASPRKRKQAEADLESLLQPSRHSVKAEDVQSANGKAPTTHKARKRSKKDIVVDEPARTDIAAQQAPPIDIKVTNGNAGKLRPEIAPNTDKVADEDSELSSPPQSEDDARLQKSKKKGSQKSKKEKAEEAAMPLAPRTSGLNMFVGAHVSIAKGVENAITNAVHIGGNALALFLQSQRKWENPELKSENKDAFHHACSHHNFDAKQHIVPHGSYLVNLAAKDADQAKKSYNFFVNDLKRCEALGIRYYNFHPGATNKAPLPEAITRLAGNLNKALAETTTVVPLLENMAGTESIIGSRFSDLAHIIAEIKPEYQGRIGICIDTCHTFAAGYDLRTPEAFQKTFRELDEMVGLKYLKAMHINDSKGMFGSKKDLHQNIGTGFLGLRPFHSIMNDPRLANVPLILETPCDRPDPEDPKKTIDDKTVWSREIKLLESLIGMDPESEEYKTLEANLAQQGKAERDQMEKWQADKEERGQKKDTRAKKKLETAEKGQKSIAGMFGKKSARGRKKTPSLSSDSSDLNDG